LKRNDYIDREDLFPGNGQSELKTPSLMERA
jgi:hypothetical protein